MLQVDEALVFYFLEYMGRSAPAVMIPELTAAFDVSVVKLSAIIGSYYYTYAVVSLLAGASLDRYGAARSASRMKPKLNSG
jgi:fucose permease